MTYPGLARFVLVIVSALTLISSATTHATVSEPEALLRQMDESPHLRQIAFSSEEVVDHEIGLGAVQKVRGEWRFKRSERLSGTLLSYTWQVVNGFRSVEVMTQLVDSVARLEGATQLFACDGRACGPAVQWANSVFNERVLYGREDFQRYRVFTFDGEQVARLIAYSAERTADRQYLHVELLLTPP